VEITHAGPINTWGLTMGVSWTGVMHQKFDEIENWTLEDQTSWSPSEGPVLKWGQNAGSTKKQASGQSRGMAGNHQPVVKQGSHGE